MLQDSNLQLFEYLKKEDIQKKSSETLFRDIAGSDGNITLQNGEFSRLCLENTINTLYGTPSAKVCWVVGKKENTLLRSEGRNYGLPLNSDDKVAVDATIKEVDLFQVYKAKGEMLIVLRQKGKNPTSFIVYGVPPKMQKKKLKAKPNKNKNKNNRKPNTNPRVPPDRGEMVTPSTVPKN